MQSASQLSTEEGKKSGVRSGPLASIRVVDCATILAGPVACQILGDFGADVIKIEHPTVPDNLRHQGPQASGIGLWWKEVARNKRTIGLLLSDSDGAEVFKQLVATTDVLVENFRPGTLERWGLGWDVLRAINPGLVMLRLTGFGQDGPYATRPAFGTLVEAMSGFAFQTGATDGPPTLPCFGLGDFLAGLTGVSAVVMGLFHRSATGLGQVVDLSLLEPIMSAVGPGPTAYDTLGVLTTRQGNRSQVNAPRNLYQTADGSWVAVSTSSNSIAERVLRLVGHPEVVGEPWFASGSGRVAHADLLDRYVGEWIRARSRDEALVAFDEVGAALAPVYSSADLVADPQVQHREMLKRVPDPDLGSLLQHNVLFKMSETPGAIRFTGRDHGADTKTILVDELGLSSGRVDDLRQRGIVK